ncbi:MAG: hypothetical protein U9R17_06955 [Thermodesulfobacteriota bacterium]|nr:hypothetical protein [Thermodesulfobacteriota bacterium]
MEKWQMSCLQVEPRTPIHCGDRPTGFVASALPFVPGHIPLMALVPHVVAASGLPNKFDSFMTAQGFLEKHLRFTPFFILGAFSRKPLVPCNETDIMAEMESHLIGSRYGVAIDYGVRGAKEAHLFEIEAINPIARERSQTIFEGYMFWRAGEHDGLEIDQQGLLNGIEIGKWISDSQWGGERNKGYGCINKVGKIKKETIWQGKVNLGSKNPVICWPDDIPAPFYLKYDQNISATIEGRLKPMVGRIFDRANGFGQSSSEALIVWDVGWVSQKQLKLEINTKTAVIAD